MADEPSEGGPERGGQPDTDHGKLAQLWADHKTPIMILIAGVTMVLTYILVLRSQQSTGSATTAGGAPGASGGTVGGTLASGGSAGVPTAQTTDSTNASFALSSYMQAILQQLQSLGSGVASGVSSAVGSVTTPPVTTAPRPPAAPTPPTAHAPSRTPAPASSARYVTVTAWHPNPAWSSTLSGIAAHEGVSLTRIEHLNPQISNPNLVYVNERVRVS